MVSILTGTVREFHAEQGWGVIEAAECPGGCWVHFSVIKMIGYRVLHVGQVVDFETGEDIVDGFDFVATCVSVRGEEAIT